MNLSRIARLLNLMRLLQAGRGHNAQALAQACRVSRRTIFRDLATLRAAEIPLQFDSEMERYHLPGTYCLPPTNFTAEEALALIVLCHETCASGRLPFFEAARDAAAKLESTLPARLREEMRVTAGAIHIHRDPISQIAHQKTFYQQLIQAFSERRAARVTYASLSDAKRIVTKLHPYQLLFSRHSWYVIGRSSVHRETRTFNLTRILALELLADRYRLPRGFSVERYLRNAWHLIPEPGRDQEVVVRFQPLVAKNVAEISWHKTQRVEWNPDGTLDFYVTVSGLQEICWWILGYGDQAEVLRPEKLREMVASRAHRMVARYNLSEAGD